MYAGRGPGCKRFARLDMGHTGVNGEGAPGTAIAVPVRPARFPGGRPSTPLASRPDTASRPTQMHYDDAARQFNFLAGLGFGTALGVGLAMLISPQKKVRVRQLPKRLGMVAAGRSSRTPPGARSGRRGWFSSP
jgi:hypothetical protein